MSTLKQAKREEVMRRLKADHRYGGGYMHSSFKALGATMSERKGTVDSWVASKSDAGLDYLIETLGGDVQALTTRWQAEQHEAMHRGMIE